MDIRTFALMLPLGAVILLMVLVRRLRSRHESLEAYQARRTEAYSADALAMRQANAAMSGAEALGPVAAGLRELLADRALAAEVSLAGHELCLRLPGGAEADPAPPASPAGSAPPAGREIRVRWVVRAVRAPDPLDRHAARAAGHWEVLEAGRAPVARADLAGLMTVLGRLLDGNEPEPDSGERFPFSAARTPRHSPPRARHRS